MATAAAVCPRSMAQAKTSGQEWLDEPDRRELPWEVKFPAASLTYDQHYLQQVRVTIDAAALQREQVERDLRLVVKAGDDERWYPGESGTADKITQKMDKRTQIEFIVQMYLRPGRHRIAVLLADSARGQHNVLHRWLEVSEIAHDPLPGLDRDLPMIEFLPPDAAALVGLPPSPERPLHVPASRPVQLQVLINFAPSTQFAGSAAEYRDTLAKFWQMTQMFAQLQPEGGCVRLLGVDVLARRVLFDVPDARRANWHDVGDAASHIVSNSTAVDVNVLKGRTRTAQFFIEQIESMLQDAPPCPDAPRDSKPARVYVVAAAGMLFPAGTLIQRADPGDAAPPEIFYLRAVTRKPEADPWRLFRGRPRFDTEPAEQPSDPKPLPYDQIPDILKALHPRTLPVYSALDFRKALATIAATLQRLGSQPH